MQVESSNPYFRDSPFSLVASEQSSKCWAGRADLHHQLTSICHSWIRRPDSTVDLMWANLGAGKTHALLHIRHLYVKENPDASPIFVFLEVPQDLSSFKDLYTSIATSLPIEELMNAAMRHSSKLSVTMQRAARAYVAAGPIARDTVHDWIVGGRPLLRELRATTGISNRIEADSEAEQVLTELVAIASLEGRRIILMFDEFQRIAGLSPKIRDKVLSHLRTVISRSPAHLSVMFAVASKVERTAVQLLPAEIRTIMGMRPLVALPALNLDAAKAFIAARLAWFRPEGFEGDPFAPLSEPLVDSTLQFLVDKLDGQLTPRVILQVFGLIFDSASEHSENLEPEAITTLLNSLRWAEL